jgi:hypothetical protein
MATNLDAILADVAALVVTDGVLTPPVYYGATIRNSWEKANLPIRVLQPVNFGVNEAKSQTMRPTFVLTVTWQIQDICLLRPAGMGRGLPDITVNLATYLSNYIDAVRTLGALHYSRGNVRGTVEMLEYPAGSGRFYDAVVITIDFLDIIQ